MSLRLQTLQVARLAAAGPLRDSADRVAQFIESQQHESGGFRDRAGKPDLYYTVFGLQCLSALQLEPDAARVADFLRGFDPHDLDLVHLGSLARCWGSLPGVAPPNDLSDAVAELMGAYRTPDGGYCERSGAKSCSAYGCFVALGTFQDLGLTMPGLDRLGPALQTLSTGDGGYANDADIRVGNVPATAATLTLQHQLQLPIDPKSGDFLLTCRHPEGGFFAMPEAPMPDLLSTATALHALSCAGRDLDAVREPCLDFVDTLWSGRGGFYGHWAEEEEALDVEYTYYGLLALGHLSV